jgi:hypothetical protein
MMPLREASSVCDIPLPTIRLWIEQGALVPELWGRAEGGRGYGHRLSYAQVLCLGVIRCLREDHGGYVGPSYVADLMNRASETTDDDILAMLRGYVDPYSEEEVAAWKLLCPAQDIPSCWSRRLSAIVEAIREREELKARWGNRRPGRWRRSRV